MQQWCCFRDKFPAVFLLDRKSMNYRRFSPDIPPFFLFWQFKLQIYMTHTNDSFRRRKKPFLPSSSAQIESYLAHRQTPSFFEFIIRHSWDSQLSFICVELTKREKSTDHRFFEVWMECWLWWQQVSDLEKSMSNLYRKKKQWRTSFCLHMKFFVECHSGNEFFFQRANRNGGVIHCLALAN